MERSGYVTLFKCVLHLQTERDFKQRDKRVVEAAHGGSRRIAMDYPIALRFKIGCLLVFRMLDHGCGCFSNPRSNPFLSKYKKTYINTQSAP